MALHARLEQAALPPTERLDVCARIAEALDAAHQGDRASRPRGRAIPEPLIAAARARLSESSFAEAEGAGGALLFGEAVKEARRGLSRSEVPGQRGGA